MKKASLLFLLLGVSLLPLSAAVTETYTYSSLNQPIPAGNASGVTLSYNPGSTIASIDSLRVSLDITSDSNGSLYFYLSHGSDICVLLNRPGRTTANLAGYDDHGFNVTFDDSQINRDIHVYNTIEAPQSGQPLTGLWQSDARLTDPDLVLDASPRNADLTSFNAKDANGTWTFFLASLESGGTTTLNSLTLEITGVPEPLTYAWATGLVLLGFAAFRKLRG